MGRSRGGLGRVIVRYGSDTHHMLASRMVSLTSMCGMSAYVLWYTSPPDLLIIQSECTPGGTPASSDSCARLCHSAAIGSMSWDIARRGAGRSGRASTLLSDPRERLDSM
jgi:hypothetical protein